MHLVICLRLVVNTVHYMVRPWVFHNRVLLRGAFGQIEVLMDDGFNPILLVSNLATLGQTMYEMFLGSKNSLFGVYFWSDLVPINKHEFGPHVV